MNEEDPKCDKCGAPITTGLMAAFCPRKEECEFWVEGVAGFLQMIGAGQENARIARARKGDQTGNFTVGDGKLSI
jgi:hypothetical protein